MNKIFFILLAFLGFLAFFILNANTPVQNFLVPKNNNEDNGVVCTMEARLCPDGSYVGRTGPKCEFTPCPETNFPQEVIATAKINQTISVLGLKITPIEVVADSRCPIDATCVWAGEIKIKVKILNVTGERVNIFKPGGTVSTEFEEITLVEANPLPRSSVNLKPEDYSFNFKITRKDSLPY